MAEAGVVNAPAASGAATAGTRPGPGAVVALRVAAVAAMLGCWEALARSGLLYQDVVPSLAAIGRAMWQLLTVPDAGGQGVAVGVAMPSFYRHLLVTAGEVTLGLAIGGVCGLAAGMVLGGSRLLAKSFEPYLHYLGPTPKIIFFPVMIMWFGVGPPSKIAMGAISCFFPIALSAASGMRGIADILVRVGRSFRAGTWQMATKVYLPAMREPVVNGLRLGLGVAIIGTLLAETKLSNQGIGFLIIQAYTVFDMPRMYAMLIVLFVLATAVNAAIGRLARR